MPATCIICGKPCRHLLCPKHGKQYEATDGGDMAEVVRWAAKATRESMRADLRVLEREIRELRSALRGLED